MPARPPVNLRADLDPGAPVAWPIPQAPPRVPLRMWPSDAPLRQSQEFFMLNLRSASEISTLPLACATACPHHFLVDSGTRAIFVSCRGCSVAAQAILPVSGVA